MNFANLPPAMKFGVAIVTGVGILGALAILFPNPMFLVILAIGIVVVGLLLVVYKFILGWMRKRKESPLHQGLSSNSASSPQGISEPARRARLDDLRRNFETGVEKFRAAGKNLYSVPWYVLVGEPGSGKTEAIRHCNVGFPPGLQDQLQGAGGTLNMNWWFTNHAIILDTAGRLMFEEVAPGSTSEWQEFLKLLKNGRPNCPINGMLLVIPVDTLIKDTADSIEKKAGKIAQQLDSIQRVLGVRFPVFVVITKCDLINGFREFFDDLNDPQLQHQIMGWSNPAQLDEKFNPEAVEQHLEVVRKRLIDRRTRLLMDPVNTEDANSRRIDQVDALYSLPDSIMKIAPRLRRYLEMIFVAGEWSPKPLFLRGIYFTSSMTEGSALDADLAEVLGIPVDALPEGRIWQRDRAYFLRDLFLNKVFREKGLVTRAGNAQKVQRQRKMIVMSAGFSAVAVLLLLTWLGHRALERSIGVHREFWVAARTLDPESLQIVTGKGNKYEYHGGDKFDVGKESTTVASFYGSKLDLVDKDIAIPLIFRPVAFLSKNLNRDRKDAYRTLYEQTVLVPAVAASRTKMNALTSDGWSDDATAALVQLMRVELAKLKVAPAADSGSAYFNVDTMLKFVLSPDEYKKVDPAEKESLQKSLDWIYTNGGGAWPASGLGAGEKANAEQLDSSISKCIAYCASQTGDKSPRIAAILSVREALKEYQAAEDQLLSLKGKVPDKTETYKGFLDLWNGRLAKLTAAKEQVAKAWAQVEQTSTGDVSLPKLYQDEVERVAGNARRTYDLLLKYMPENLLGKDNVSLGLTADRQKVNAEIARLNDWRNTATSGPLQADLAELDKNFLAKIKGADGQAARRYDVVLSIYQSADKQLPKDLTAAPKLEGSVASTLGKVDANIGAVSTAIDKVATQISSKEDRLATSCGFGQNALEAASRCQKYLVVSDALKHLPATPEAWTDFVIAHPGNGDHMGRPSIPLVTSDKVFAAKFDIDAVGGVTDDKREIEKALQQKSDGVNILDREALAAAFEKTRPPLEQYMTLYSSYWSRDAIDELKFGAKNWSEFASRLNNSKEVTIRASLEEFGQKLIDALTRVGDEKGVAAVKSALAFGQRKAFQEECNQVLTDWKDVGEESRKIRRQVLSMQPTKFRDLYTVSSAKDADNFVAKYWMGLGVEAVRILANDGQADVVAGLAELNKYDRFPLAPLGNGKDTLTEADIAAARAALQNVLGVLNTVKTGEIETIGQGGKTRDKDIDEQMERLRGQNLLAGKEAYLGQLKAVLKSLPESGKTMPCGLSVIKEKLKDDKSASDPFAHMAIIQGKKELGVADLRAPTIDKIQSAEFPGEPLTLGFREVPNGPVVRSNVVEGPWAAIRLLHTYNAKRDPKDGHKWSLDMPINAKGADWHVWLQLEFEQELPELSDWPSAGNTKKQ